jgi:hypothetical protein
LGSASGSDAQTPKETDRDQPRQDVSDGVPHAHSMSNSSPQKQVASKLSKEKENGGKAVKAEKPLPMKLNGKPFVVATIPPVVQKIMDYLDSLSDDDIFDKAHLINEKIASKDSISQASRTEAFKPYCLLTDASHPLHQTRYLFGNPRGIINLIAEIKRQSEAQS